MSDTREYAFLVQYQGMMKFLKHHGKTGYIDIVRSLFKDNLFLAKQIEQLKGVSNEQQEGSGSEGGEQRPNDETSGSGLGEHPDNQPGHGNSEDPAASTHVGQGEG